MKRILLAAFVLLFAGIANAQLISVEFEEYYVHDDTEYPADPQTPIQNLDGYVTYRLYANVTNPDDFVLNVFGNVDNPLIIELTDENEQFYQHPGGGFTGPMNSTIVGIYPLVEYDSYLTIGHHIDAENPTYGAITTIAGPGDNWAAEFEDGDDIVSDNFAGLSYFVTPGVDNGVAGDDLRVSIGQFTINRANAGMHMNFSGSVQVFTNGVSSDVFEDDFYYAFATTATGQLGCTDPLAENFDPLAEIDDNSCEFPCTLMIDAADLIITDATCFGEFSGSVDISVVEGAQGSVLYSTDEGSFVVSSLFDGLPAGDYVYEVEDAGGCSASVEYSIGQGAEIVITENGFDSIDPSCFGFSDGQVCVEIAGGLAPYFTSVNTEDFSGESSELCFGDLPSGNHIVYVQDANECVVNSTAIILTDPLEMELSVTPTTPASCADVADACAIALATGGVPTITYEIEGWIDAQSDNTLCGLLPEMDYTVVATDDNGCTVSGILTGVTGPAQVGVNANSIDDVSCFGNEDGEICVSGFGGNGNFGYSINDCEGFEFNDGCFDGLVAGDYVICAESDGCTGSDTFTVGEPNAIQYDVTPTAENSGVSEAGECDGMFEVINEGGGTGELTIVWTLADGTQVVGNIIEDLCETEMGDVINLTITDENGCVSTEDFSMAVGLYELENNIQISMFPNPTNGIVNLSIEGLAGQAVNAKVLNSIGAEVQSTDFGTLSGIWNKEINLLGQASGVYFLNITVGNENISHRIIKQ